MPTATQRMEPIRLNYAEKDRQVVLLPRDEDRYVLTVEEAIAACRAGKEQERFRSQFKGLLNRLGQWVTDHESKIHKAYVTIRNEGILFLVVRRSTQYDGEFSDRLSDLDIEVANEDSLNLVQLNVLALPNVTIEACTSFLNPELVFEYTRKNA